MNEHLVPIQLPVTALPASHKNYTPSQTIYGMYIFTICVENVIFRFSILYTSVIYIIVYILSKFYGACNNNNIHFYFGVGGRISDIIMWRIPARGKFMHRI